MGLNFGIQLLCKDNIPDVCFADIKIQSFIEYFLY